MSRPFARRRACNFKLFNVESQQASVSPSASPSFYARAVVAFGLAAIVSCQRRDQTEANLAF